MEPQKFDYIDALRGIAILLVILVHAFNHFDYSFFFNNTATQVLNNSAFGVQLFFLVSAYTLMLSYNARKREEHRWTHFYLRRFFRIAPIYYIGIIYYSIQNYLGFRFLYSGVSASDYPIRSLITNLLFIHDWFPSTINNLVPGGWSIGVEMTFYLLFPLIVKYITSLKKSLILFLGSLTLTMILKKLLVETVLNQDFYLYLWFPNNLAIFSLGIMGYFILNQKNRTKEVVLICFILLLLILINYYFNIPSHIFHGIIFLGLLIYFSTISFKSFIMQKLVTIGKLSYSIYIIHFAILHFMIRFKFMQFIPMTSTFSSILHITINYIITTSVSTLIAYLSYKYIEIRFIKFGKRFYS